MLPRLKYHNPGVPMTVNRTSDQAGPATLFVHFSKPLSSGKPLVDTSSTTTYQASTASITESSNGALTERVETIDMKHRHSAEIFSQFLTLTNARELEPTPDEKEQLQELKIYQARSARDRARNKAYHDAKKREAAILAQAKAEIAADAAL